MNEKEKIEKYQKQLLEMSARNKTQVEKVWQPILDKLYGGKKLTSFEQRKVNVLKLGDEK